MLGWCDWFVIARVEENLKNGVSSCTHSLLFLPDVLWHAQSARRISVRIWLVFIESYIVFSICLIIFLYLRCEVYSYPVKQTIIIFKQKKRKTTVAPSRNNNLLFFWWPHYAPPHLHRSVTRLPASVSRFLCLPLTGFPTQRSLYPAVPRNGSWQWNLWQTVPNCPQLTPGIALSVMPTVFGYIVYSIDWAEMMMDLIWKETVVTCLN